MAEPTPRESVTDYISSSVESSVGLTESEAGDLESRASVVATQPEVTKPAAVRAAGPLPASSSTSITASEGGLEVSESRASVFGGSGSEKPKAGAGAAPAPPTSETSPDGGGGGGGGLLKLLNPTSTPAPIHCEGVGKKKAKTQQYVKEYWNWEWRKTKELGAGAGVGGGAGGEGGEGGGDGGEEAKFQYPLIAYTEVAKHFESEMMDTIMSAVDRYSSDYEKACEYIVKEFDRLYEPMWHCVVGKNIGFDVTFDQQCIMYMFYNGNIGILVWKTIVY